MTPPIIRSRADLAAEVASRLRDAESREFMCREPQERMQLSGYVDALSEVLGLLRSWEALERGEVIAVATTKREEREHDGR